MGNLPRLFGIIYKHIYNNVYPFVLPKMAPFCTKITINWGRSPRAPFNHDCFTYYYAIYVYIVIIKQNSIIQPLNLQIHYLQKKKSHEKSCPASSLLNQPTFRTPPPPPPLGFFVVVVVLFKTFFAGENNILALVYMKINFPAVLMLKINNLSRLNLPAPPPPPQNQMVVPLYITKTS